MTIGAIILDIIILLILTLFVIYITSDIGVIPGIISLFIGLIIFGGFFCGQLWYYSSTESGKRAIKSQESDFNGGITREVKVYSMDGKILQEYKGKFDVDYDDDRVIFDDEKGLRHIIYYPTGTVIINEIKENKDGK